MEAARNGRAGHVDGGEWSLLTDLYELTMAYAYWRSGTHEKEAVFQLHFRKPPFDGGFTLACGLAPAIELIESFRFGAEELDYLAGVAGSRGKPLFPAEFLEHLGNLRLSCDLDALPEGTVVFPHEPLIRVKGPILQAQILESALLNLINFQTLIATKAARIGLAAEGDPVIEFGLRRAQGVDGALAAARASFVGGCAGTSNVLAGKLYGIPVMGTHAHSWVLSFDSELESFEAYAEAMPDNCVFLVDTYDSLEGVRNAVRVGRRLRERGHEMMGIRLDSGDLAYLSVEARKILDAAGFPQAKITASSELDEHVMRSLKRQGAKIDVWGVGTRLVTGHDDPALGGVYKLTAVREPGGPWQYKVKLSEQAIKITNPGIHQVRRFRSETEFLEDMIWDEGLGIASDAPTMIDPLDLTRRKRISPDTPWEDLLVPVFRRGERVYDPPPLAAVQSRAREQLSRFHGGVKRFVNPHRYPVGLEEGLFDLRTRLILRARGFAPAGEKGDRP
jgi:nicotinate phosphoribosyltransferase